MSTSFRSIVPQSALTVATVVAAVGCAANQPGGLGAGTLVVFPPPPDTVRIQFLARFSTSRDITGSGKSFWRSLVGEEGDQGKAIIKPYGIAIADGTIYVCDTMRGGLEVIDLRHNTFDYFDPRGLGTLEKPINCFIDKASDRLYVADVERGQVVVFDSLGQYVAGFGEREQVRPTDVFVDARHVWVCDIRHRTIQVYDKADYHHVASVPDVEPDTPGVLFNPTNLYVTDDRLYVTDFGDFKVKIYSLGGQYLRSVGSYGRGLGQFARPKGIAVDRASNLYVVDAAFQNVQVFDPDGRLLTFFGGGYQGPGYMWLPAKVIVDYDNLELFQRYVHPNFQLEHLILVTNQYGPDKVTVYGFVEPKPDTVATR